MLIPSMAFSWGWGMSCRTPKTNRLDLVSSQPGGVGGGGRPWIRCSLMWHCLSRLCETLQGSAACTAP